MRRLHINECSRCWTPLKPGVDKCPTCDWIKDTTPSRSPIEIFLQGLEDDRRRKAERRE